jgi:hypothetical protein
LFIILKQDCYYKKSKLNTLIIANRELAILNRSANCWTFLFLEDQLDSSLQWRDSDAFVQQRKALKEGSGGWWQHGRLISLLNSEQVDFKHLQHPNP